MAALSDEARGAVGTPRLTFVQANWWRELVIQTVLNVWGHKLRSALTMFGVAWGIASIIFMMAIGDGFKLGYQQSLAALGTDIAIIWGGRTAGQAGDQRAGRPIRLTMGDVEAIRSECFLVGEVTPELDRSLKVVSPHNAGTFSVHGVAPVYQEIRSMRLAAGRRITVADEQEARAVCLIGDEVKQQLFADRSAVGALVRIQDIPFTVVGELAKKDQNNSYNGFDGTKVVIPYPTMARYFPDPRPYLGVGAVDNLIVMPRSADEHEALLLTFVSGAVGVAFAWAVSAAVALLPLPTMFAGLPITRWTAVLAFGTLVIVGILSAVYPARRAARLAPVEALRYE